MARGHLPNRFFNSLNNTIIEEGTSDFLINNITCVKPLNSSITTKINLQLSHVGSKMGPCRSMCRHSKRNTAARTLGGWKLLVCLPKKQNLQKKFPGAPPGTPF